MQQQRRVHEALAATLDADPDRRAWHRAALVSGTDEELARELEDAGMRARRQGAIDVALTALRRAVQLSGPDHRSRRMFATAELAYERGRPDIAAEMLREIERLDLDVLEVAQARYISELLDARALADRSRVADLIAIAEQAGAAGDRDLHHSLLWIAARAHLVVEPGSRTLGSWSWMPPIVPDRPPLPIRGWSRSTRTPTRTPTRPRWLACLRDAAQRGVDGAEPAGYLCSAGIVTGAFYDSLQFCATAIDHARAEGRLGRLPRLLATQAILAVRLPNWDIAIPAAEEARRLAIELGQPIWLATAETAVAMIAALRGDPTATRERHRPCRADRPAARRDPHRRTCPVRSDPLGAGARSP